MREFSDRLLNILLLPAGFYRRLNRGMLTLCLGVIATGVFDVFFPDFIEICRKLFAGRTSLDVRYNILVSAALTLLLGTVDVVFFSIPLYDFFKYLKKKEGTAVSVSPVQVMKAYIVSNLIIVPVATVLDYAVFNSIDINSNIWLAYFFVILIWSSAIVTRGINALFSFNPILRKLTFIIVFTWSFVLGMVFEYQIADRLMALLR